MSATSSCNKEGVNMNPISILKLKPHFETFCQDHPKLLMFFSAAAEKIDKDSVLEVTIKNSHGYKIKTNIKINDNDVAFFGEFKNLIKK